MAYIQPRWLPGLLSTHAPAMIHPATLSLSRGERTRQQAMQDERRGQRKSRGSMMRFRLHPREPNPPDNGGISEDATNMIDRSTSAPPNPRGRQSANASPPAAALSLTDTTSSASRCPVSHESRCPATETNTVSCEGTNAQTSGEQRSHASTSEECRNTRRVGMGWTNRAERAALR